MPIYEVFLKKLNVIEPVIVSEVEAKNEEQAILEASTELGMHWERSVNIDNVMPELQAKLKEVI